MLKFVKYLTIFNLLKSRGFVIECMTKLDIKNNNLTASSVGHNQPPNYSFLNNMDDSWLSKDIQGILNTMILF